MTMLRTHTWSRITFVPLITGAMILAPASLRATAASHANAGHARMLNQPIVVTVGYQTNEFSQAEIDHFNKTHKDIQIKLEDVSQAGKLQALLASGNAPDIIRVVGATDATEYIIKGIALDLEPYFKKSTNVFPPADVLPAANVYRFNGTTQGIGDRYGFPKDWSPDFTLWYNKKLFQAAHVPLPSTTNPMTWDQVMTLAKRLTVVSNGKVTRYGLGWSLGLTQPDYDVITLQMKQLGQTLWSKDFHKANLESAAAEKVIKTWVDAVAGNYGPNGKNHDPNWSGAEFQSGKMAMILSGYWFSGMFRQLAVKDESNFVMAPGPVMAGRPRIDPTTTATGAIVYSKTKHPDQTWTVFEYLFGAGSMPVADRAASGWGVPVFKSDFSKLPNKTAFDKQTLSTLKNELPYTNVVLPFNPYVDSATVNTVLGKYLTPVFYGRDTLSNALKKVDSDLDNYIESSLQTIGG